MGGAASPGVKRQGHEAVQLHQFSAEDKNGGSVLSFARMLRGMYLIN
jgi:hypothetical protein